METQNGKFMGIAPGLWVVVIIFVLIIVALLVYSKPESQSASSVVAAKATEFPSDSQLTGDSWSFSKSHLSRKYPNVSFDYPEGKVLPFDLNPDVRIVNIKFAYKVNDVSRWCYATWHYNRNNKDYECKSIK